MDKIELRVFLRYCWKRDLSTRDAAKEINDAEGEETMSQPTVSRWFKRFNSGDPSLEDQPRSGRPTKLDDGVLQAALDAEPSSSTRELATDLGVKFLLHPAILKSNETSPSFIAESSKNVGRVIKAFE